MESILWLILGLALAYGLVCAYAYWLGPRFLFARVAPTYKFSPEVTLVTSKLGHSIPLLYLPAAGAPKAVILYSHGNMEDLGFIRPRLEAFQRQGYSIVAYDYPGFGIATGTPNEASINAAAEAVYNYLIKEQKIDPNEIIVYGRSLGGGPTAYLAANFPVGGVVMHSTFVSAFRVQTGIELLPWDYFGNLQLIPKMKGPIFFVHGLSDETIPAWHTEMMMEAATVAKRPFTSLLVRYALHNNVIEIARDDFWTRMAEFVAMVKEAAKTTAR